MALRLRCCCTGTIQASNCIHVGVSVVEMKSRRVVGNLLLSPCTDGADLAPNTYFFSSGNGTVGLSFLPLRLRFPFVSLSDALRGLSARIHMENLQRREKFVFFTLTVEESEPGTGSDTAPWVKTMRKRRVFIRRVCRICVVSSRLTYRKSAKQCSTRTKTCKSRLLQPWESVRSVWTNRKRLWVLKTSKKVN